MRKTVVNIASLFISVVANRIFPILLLPFLARALGPEQFGHYVMASAFSYLLAQIVEWGFNMTGVRDIALVAHEKTKVGKIIITVGFSRALISLLLLFICAAASPWLSWVAPSATLFWAAVIYGLLYAFDFRFGFYGLQESRPFLILSFMQYLVSFAGVVSMVRGPADAWLAFAIPSACGIVSVLYSLWLLQKWAVFSKPSLNEALASIRNSLQVFLARNVFQSSSQLGVLVLGLFAAPQVVGWFGVNERISRTLGQLILYPLQMGLTPVVLQNSRTKQRRAVLIHLGGLGCAVLAAIITGVGLYFYAPRVLQILLGSSPDEAIHALRMLSIYPLIFVLIHQGGIFWLYLLRWDRENLIILLTYTTAFVSLLFLFASWWQLNGVVAGVLVSGSSLVLIFFLFCAINRILPWQQPLGIALAKRRSSE